MSVDPEILESGDISSQHMLVQGTCSAALGFDIEPVVLQIEILKSRVSSMCF